MTYRICYFRDGKEQGSTPWPGTLEMMKRIACDGLVRHGMDRAIITDDEGTIVWSSTGPVQEKRRGIPQLLEAVLRVIGRRPAQ